MPTATHHTWIQISGFSVRELFVHPVFQHSVTLRWLLVLHTASPGPETVTALVPAALTSPLFYAWCRHWLPLQLCWSSLPSVLPPPPFQLSPSETITLSSSLPINVFLTLTVINGCGIHHTSWNVNYLLQSKRLPIKYSTQDNHIHLKPRNYNLGFHNDNRTKI